LNTRGLEAKYRCWECLLWKLSPIAEAHLVLSPRDISSWNLNAASIKITQLANIDPLLTDVLLKVMGFQDPLLIGTAGVVGKAAAVRYHAPPYRQHLTL
jgi:hypothetical protein